jgi:hypothetical protein
VLGVALPRNFPKKAGLNTGEHKEHRETEDAGRSDLSVCTLGVGHDRYD